MNFHRATYLSGSAFIGIVATLILSLGFIGELTAQERELAEIARQVALDLEAAEYEKVVERFDARMQAALTADRLRKTWTGLTAEAGKLKKAEYRSARKNGQEFTTITVICLYESTKVALHLTFDTDGKIAGMFAQPIAADEEAETIGVEVELPTKTSTLYGSLLMPEDTGNRRVDAVLLIAGSGATDRNGNQGALKTNVYKQLAIALAKHQIATLRIDKRGVGKSRPENFVETELHFDNYVHDAIGWSNWLRRNPKINRVFILGHSQGALVAKLAADKALPDGVISVAGSGIRAGDLILRQLKPRLPDSMYAEAESIVSNLRNKQPVEDVSPVLQAIFRNSVLPFLASYDQFDPVQAARQLKHTPLLVVQGDKDVQISVDDAKLIDQAAPHSQLVVIKDMSHVLKTISPEVSQQRVYQDPTVPIENQLVDELVRWINDTRGED